MSGDSKHRRADLNVDIEALRAAAVTVTVIAHLGTLNPAWLRPLGFFWLGGGVDLFFCISGFLITTSLLHTQDAEGSFREFAIPFWTRRVFRLWPAAVFWVMIDVACAILFHDSLLFGDIGGNISSGIAAVLQIENFHIVSCAVFYFSPCRGNALFIYWSLSLEEQFYILLPIALFFVRRRHLVPASFVIVVAQTFLSRPNPSIAWFFRTDALLLGVVIAFARHNFLTERLGLRVLARSWGRLLVVGSLLFLMVVMARQEVVSFYGGIVAILAAVLVLLASYDARIIVASDFARKVASAIGARSYSIYLTHMTAFLITREVGFRLGIELPTWMAIIGAAAILVTLSEGSYRLIEIPTRRYGRRLSAGQQRARQLALTPDNLEQHSDFIVPGGENSFRRFLGSNRCQISSSIRRRMTGVEHRG